MARVKDYTSGKVVEYIKAAFSVMDRATTSLQETEMGKVLEAEVEKMIPTKITLEQANELIAGAAQCAVGERVCRVLHTDTPLTESVFLDELAIGMAEAGKARLVTREEAIENLKKFNAHAIILSRVSDKPMEICPSWPKRCLYWNMEKHGLKCIHR
ncbi:MAG: hypothetical protein HY881_28365 [Deltaproteobacteria bacterium]|nr:hypothetical protein [Deltaproteobacteria bacterium]